MTSNVGDADVVLIGGGIMSATLGMLLKRACPDWTIVAFERLDAVGEESSWGWNNAGTGHAGLCELNYTPERPDGSIDTAKAHLVNGQFQESLQFWASLVDQGVLSDPASFIRPVPHMSYVSGASDVDFLHRRYEALAGEPLFEDLRITGNRAEMAEWVPLMMEGRGTDAPVAMTRSDDGTDVDYGKVTRLLFAAFERQGGELRRNTEVEDLDRQPNGRWRMITRDRRTSDRRAVQAKFVFIGAGGYAIRLLQRADIAEAKGYGGFPVSGQFLRCTNASLIERHHAKVYGKSQVNAPPMSMPHLDRRVIDGTPGLLFGPYAGFTPKYLKHGSYTDLIRSVRPDNLPTMLAVARDEFGLTKYLVEQVVQKYQSRIEVLRDFMPMADGEDWELIHAGQRVQTMKRTPSKRGVLAFGTEVVAASDGSIAGLLGASPGASTAVSIMLDVLRRCFPAEFPGWAPRLQELVPSLGTSLADDPVLRSDVRDFVQRTLGLVQEPALAVV